MATSDRPSGLTALAVIQFIFCPLEGIGCIGLIAMRLIAGQTQAEAHPHPESAIFASIPWLNIIALVIFGMLSALLLLLSGIAGSVTSMPSSRSATLPPRWSCSRRSSPAGSPST